MLCVYISFKLSVCIFVLTLPFQNYWKCGSTYQSVDQLIIPSSDQSITFVGVQVAASSQSHLTYSSNRGGGGGGGGAGNYLA